MSSSQYHPLDTGVGARPVQRSVLRGARGSNVFPLWRNKATSRRVFVCVMILMILVVYVVWCAVANYTDDGRGGFYATTTENRLATELSNEPCAESFVDSRVYIQDKLRQEWDNLSTIYFVTPTYPRPQQSDFDQQLENAGDKLVVVDFFATWCGPCKMIAPKLEELSKEYVDKVVVIKVDVDECEDVAIEYSISSMPTFIFIKNKQKVDEFAGANAEKLAATIAKLI